MVATFRHWKYLIPVTRASYDVASYADDTTPSETGGNSEYVVHNLEVLGNKLLNWFSNNSMKFFCLVMTPGK